MLDTAAGSASGGNRRSWSTRGYLALLAAVALVAVAPLATQSFGVETPASSEDAAVIAELRAALDQTAFRLALLEARDADTEASALGKHGDVRSVAVTVGLLSLRERSRTDQPFATELALIRPLLARVPGSEAAIAPLLAYADAGVPSVADLAVEFGRLEPLLTAQIDATASAGSHGRGLVRSILAAVELAQPAEPDGRLASLEKIGIDLSRGRLDLAVATAESLDPPTRVIASGWLAAARVRLALDRNVEALVQSALAAMVAAP